MARFLNVEDCANVVILNREFSVKTWVVVLRCLHRVNECIQVDQGSLAWIEKYAQELRYQKLVISDHFSTFFRLHIPRLDTLKMVGYRGAKRSAR